MENYLFKVTPTERGTDPEARRFKCLLTEHLLMIIKLSEIEAHHFLSQDLTCA